MLQIFSSTLSFIFLVLLMVFFAMQVYFYFYVISFVNLLLHLGHKKLLLYSGCRGIHPCFLLVSLFNIQSSATFGEGFPDSSVGEESAYNAGDSSLIPGSGRSSGEGIGYPLQYSWASLVAQLVKNPQCGRSGFDPWVEKIPWRRERVLTPVFWPGEFHELYSICVTKSQTELSNFHFLSKIIEDGDCSHEIKRWLLLGRKAMTNLEGILKSRDLTLLTKVHIVKTVVFPRWHSGKKNPPANAGDARDSGLIPGQGRYPGVGNGNLLQYSSLGHFMDRGAWRATVHGDAKSCTRPSDSAHTHKGYYVLISRADIL